MPAIDVLLPVRNGLPFLKASIDSIRAQTFGDWRLHVLDHGSTDGSRELSELIAARDRRVIVHHLPQAKDLSELLNHGIDRSDCEVLVRQDADDVSLPERFAVQLDAMRSTPTAVAIGSNASIIDEAGRAVGDMKLPVGEVAVSATALFSNPIAHPTVAFNFTALRCRGIRYGIDVLGVLPESERISIEGPAQDYFLFGQLAVRRECVNLGRTLVKYRRHSTQVGAKNFARQIDNSARIARYLARNVTALSGIPLPDPLLFANFGGAPFATARVDLELEWRQFCEGLKAHFGHSEALMRELTYRRILAHRTLLTVAMRYLQFRHSHELVADEYACVRTLLLALAHVRPLKSAVR